MWLVRCAAAAGLLLLTVCLAQSNHSHTDGDSQDNFKRKNEPSGNGFHVGGQMSQQLTRDKRDLPVGPDGPIGQTGPQGPAGPKGVVGATGPTGDKGAQGFGDKGAKGADGHKGQLGDDGPKGEIGATGEKGEKGQESTVKGDIGDRGPKGDKGDEPQGDTGDKGSQGEKGDVGGTGHKGEQGDKGVQGDQGQLCPPMLSITSTINGGCGSSCVPLPNLIANFSVFCQGNAHLYSRPIGSTEPLVDEGIDFAYCESSLGLWDLATFSPYREYACAASACGFTTVPCPHNFFCNATAVITTTPPLTLQCSAPFHIYNAEDNLAFNSPPVCTAGEWPNSVAHASVYCALACGTACPVDASAQTGGKGLAFQPNSTSTGCATAACLPGQIMIGCNGATEGDCAGSSKVAELGVPAVCLGNGNWMISQSAALTTVDRVYCRW